MRARAEVRRRAGRAGAGRDARLRLPRTDAVRALRQRRRAVRRLVAARRRPRRRAARDPRRLRAGPDPLAQPPGRADGARARRDGGPHPGHPRRPRHAEPPPDAVRGRLSRARGPARAGAPRGGGERRARDRLARAGGGARRALSAAPPRRRLRQLRARARPAARAAPAPARPGRAAADRLPGHAVGQRRALRPARAVRGDRGAGPVARRLPRPRGARVPLDPRHPRARDAAVRGAAARARRATTSAGPASTPRSTARTSTPRSRTSSTSTSPAGCR